MQVGTGCFLISAHTSVWMRVCSHPPFVGSLLQDIYCHRSKNRACALGHDATAADTHRRTEALCLSVAF